MICPRDDAIVPDGKPCPKCMKRYRDLMADADNDFARIGADWFFYVYLTVKEWARLPLTIPAADMIRLVEAFDAAALERGMVSENETIIAMLWEG